MKKKIKKEYFKVLSLNTRGIERIQSKSYDLFSLVSQIMYFHIADNFYKTFLLCFLGMGKGTSQTEEGLHHHLPFLPALSLFPVC